MKRARMLTFVENDDRFTIHELIDGTIIARVVNTITGQSSWLEGMEEELRKILDKDHSTITCR